MPINQRFYYDQRFIEVLQQQLFPPHIQVPIAEVAPSSEEGEMINNFRMGCDPEFMLLDKATGLTANADNYFPHAGEVGYDHGGRVAEFRPGPSRGILPIIKKIQTLMPRALNTGRRLRAGALCNNDCLGGHIHFGFNAFENRDEFGGARYVPENANALAGFPLNQKGKEVARALDKLTHALERLDILPSHESAQRRVHGQGYGRFGDVRNCQGHMEYRSMASWLYDPKVAFLCLTAAKIAAADPAGTIKALHGCNDFPTFRNWLQTYENKDINAKRASEKLLDKGLKVLQVDPEVDFGERWRELGV